MPDIHLSAAWGDAGAALTCFGTTDNQIDVACGFKTLAIV